METVAVVLAGGTGTRLYPFSRSDRPKQFQSFGGGASLFERAVERVSFADHVIVSTREAFAAEAATLAPDAEVLVEPVAKDTGPALVFAADHVASTREDAVMFCAPSDHWIEDDLTPDATIATSVAARTGDIVTLGVTPTRPATGYGYIVPEARDGAAWPVERFTEKPDVETAARLIDAGALWNAGMFAFTPGAFLDAARASALAPLVMSLEDDEPVAGFDAIEPVSVDHAILEGASDISVVPTDVNWDDLGSWDAIDRLVDGDNAVIGDALAIDATGNVLASDDHHVSVLGVDDLVVAAHGDRVLVVPKTDAQRVRDVVAHLETIGRY